MPVRVWLYQYDSKRLHEYSGTDLEHYAGEGADSIVTGELDGGRLTRLKLEFVLGKVKFWVSEGDAHRVAWVRVDNHGAFPHGLALTGEDWITFRYHKKARMIDQLTILSRVSLFSAPDNDFIRRVFTTYNSPVKVPKTREYEQHLLLYCDTCHLFQGRVAAHCM